MLVVIQRVDGSGVVFDATPQESHSSKATATRFPVERPGGGIASVSDHLTEDPDTLDLVGVVAAEPLVDGLGIRAGGAPLDKSEPMPADADRARKAYDDLRAMKSGADLLKVLTLRRTYEDMVIVGISTTVDVATATTLVVNVSLQQVRTARTERSAIVPGRIRRDGKRTGKPPKQEPAEVANQSTLRKMAKSAVGRFGDLFESIGSP